MSKNVEIKIRIGDRADIESKVAAIADTGPDTLTQTDTFFHCDRGRFKLRQFSPRRGELIYYERDNKSGPKSSYYERFPTAEPERLARVLSIAYGARNTVRKVRTLYLIGRTRVHLDVVEALGDFLELEVVLNMTNPKRTESTKRTRSSLLWVFRNPTGFLKRMSTSSRKIGRQNDSLHDPLRSDLGASAPDLGGQPAFRVDCTLLYTERPMNRWKTWCVVWVCGAPLVGCSCNDDSVMAGRGPCAASFQAEIDGCGAACSDAEECLPGLFCGADQLCTAKCSADGTGCFDTERCTDEGRCVPASSFDGSIEGSGDGSNVCAEVEVEARRVTPTVIMIIDKSATMQTAFDGGEVGAREDSRWDAMRKTLLDPTNGVVPPLADQVRFGVTLYTATNGGNNTGPADDPCPMLDSVPPALSNQGAIESGFLPRSWRFERGTTTVVPPDPDGFVGEDTPTGDAIAAVTQSLVDAGELPSPTGDPVIYILATDGEPDRCENGDAYADGDTPEARRNEQLAFDEVTDAVGNASRMYGVQTYALFVGPTTNDIVRGHLTDVAQAGGTESFLEATDAAELRTDIGNIVRAQVSCQLVLNGTIPEIDRACEGTVTLDGRALECNQDWMAVSGNRIEIVGDACDELQTGAALRATFPCDAVILL